jgi:hypothetical protein
MFPLAELARMHTNTHVSFIVMLCACMSVQPRTGAWIGKVGPAVMGIHTPRHGRGQPRGSSIRTIMHPICSDRPLCWKKNGCRKTNMEAKKITQHGT